MNNLYEYGGIADVLIKPNIDMVIGNKTYKANEPYTILRDVQVNLLYEQINSNIAAKKPVGSSQAARPYQIAISNITLTQKVCNLILTKDEESNYTKTVNEKIIAENESLYLSNEPINNNIFVYDSSFAAAVVENTEANILTGDFIDGQEYLVFYDITDSGSKYKLEVPHYPYFTFEITAKGNDNKTTSDVYFKFPAVSIVTVPNFNIVYNNILNTPLVADIIYLRQEEPTIIFG